MRQNIKEMPCFCFVFFFGGGGTKNNTADRRSLSQRLDTSRELNQRQPTLGASLLHPTPRLLLVKLCNEWTCARRGTRTWQKAKVKRKATKTMNPRPAFTITGRQYPPPATPPRLQPAPELQSHLHGGTMILSLAQTWSSLSWSHNCSSLVNDRLCNLIPHAHTTQPPTSLSGFLGSHSSLFLHLHIVPTQSHMLLSPLTHWAILQFTFWNYWTLLGEGNSLHVRLKGQRNCLL